MSFFLPSWLTRQAPVVAPGHDLPLRGELLNLEQLTRQAKELATQHQVTVTKGSTRLLARLDYNEQILRAYTRETYAKERTRRVTHAGEWLLDNFYLIEEQVQMARRHLPRGYSRELPSLTVGPSEGLPRVYDLMLELISHVDAQVEIESLSAFVAGYQTVSPLKLGELWAVPIMLRLGLLEDLQRITSRLTIARKDRDLADEWVQRLQEIAGRNPTQLVVVVADMAKSSLPLSSAFVAEFCQQLARQSPILNLARTWLEQRLVEHGLSIEQMIQQESQAQAADQITVRHSIGALRFLGTMDWREFVETLSLVDQTLASDPSGVYGTMDFATRDRYRHAVERLARYSRFTEDEVAQKAIELAAASAQPSGRSTHVGYYLIDKGQPALEKKLAVRWPWRAKMERAIQRWPMVYYGGGVALLTALSTASLVAQIIRLGLDGWKLFVCGLVFALASSQLAIGLVNWISTLLVKPGSLPRLDYSEGIATDCQTMVVVPTMLSSNHAIDSLLETLEIHYLANRDASLHFGLLTDFRDAAAETMPEDGDLLQRVHAGVKALAKKYEADRRDIFFLFHRPRFWNEAEGQWMGYERKRGKLAQFNSLLRGGPRNCFSLIVGETSILPAIKFVITLDTDTQLPRDSARQLVGAMAHPLNRPELNKAGIVVEGYGILQPRVGVSLPSAGRSWFVRLFAGDVGVDPYTKTVSDVYQDVFQEGSFIGKGIYDVDAFQQALAGRFPENVVLSHDLIESCHARSALVADVELYEEYPARYNTDMTRRHRWIRGDWQIAQWLMPRVPGPDARRIANPLSGLSQWKIFDNLRRSLVPLAMTLLLVGNWVLLPALGGLGPLFALAIILAPALLAAGVDLLRCPDELPFALHARRVALSIGRSLGQGFLTFVFLPYDAFVSIDAVTRTLLRVVITHKRLLQWQTASEAEGTARNDLQGFFAAMWIEPLLAVIVGFYLVRHQPQQLPLAGPILLLWLTAPWIAWRISQPIKVDPMDLKEKQITFLHQAARKTWRFFETYVTAQENWLPPDNFQEEPAAVIATRTSPTNIGLSLLANITAYDFGYLPAGRLIERTQNTFATLQKLERHKGHFYNWYDTRTLQPLLPHYVSSVDSGNLAGHLLVLGAGLRELGTHEILPTQMFAGLRATLEIILELDGKNSALKSLAHDLAKPPVGLKGGLVLLQKMAALKIELPGDAGTELKWWAATFHETVCAHLDDLILLAPWLASAESTWPKFDHIPTLSELSKLPSPEAVKRFETLETLARQCEEFATMDASFLFDEARHLFSIGYNVTEHRLDASFYDLLASESRLGSFVAIAQGQVSQEHWFSLGRLLVAEQGHPVLASWNGSMFEYLMPLLVMPNYDRTLLDQTYRGSVHRQIEYGRAHHIPWGVSESGYNRTDTNLNYQYHAFGVPGLGLKRGLADDVVIAPYATALALMVEPRAACENLQRLAEEKQEGACGFYEAVDYTPSRLPSGEKSVTIRSFMAHHQGMALLSFAYVLLGRPMQRRFLAVPAFRAADLLLQERVPNAVAKVLTENLEWHEPLGQAAEAEEALRVFTNPSLPSPQVHLLSNGRFHTVVTTAGGGYSRWRDLSITRWREDSIRDNWGTFIYLRDPVTGEVWSSALQPALNGGKQYEAIFTQGRAEFRQRHGWLETHTEIAVSPEDDVELRRVTLVNHSNSKRSIELTSYAEVVLAPANADAAHPAFSNLFVQTEFLHDNPAILCTRRPRTEGEKPPWLVHVLASQGGEQGVISCETDRAKFIGRGGTMAQPAAMKISGPLSNTVGPVLDPIISLRRTITLGPQESAHIDLVIGVTETRDQSLALADKYRNARLADRAFDLAWTHSQVTLRHLNAGEADAQLYARLASALIYANPARRATASVLLNNRRGQSSLWSYGVSGDVPIVLLRMNDGAKMEIVQQLVQAHAYCRMKGLPVELIILNEDTSFYRQSLHEQITALVTSSIEAQMLDKPGGIFIRRMEQIPAEDRLLLQSSARVVLDDKDGTLAEQLDRPVNPEPVIPALNRNRSPFRDQPPALPARELMFDNGTGGFTPDGKEYVITLQPNQATPAPWVNVLANPFFGTIVSESGSAYSWVENCHEFRLTPWHNDPVGDPSGEVIYLRDEQTGVLWSPTPQPVRSPTPYVIRHGFGYTIFEHTENGIQSELTVYVAMDAPVKFSTLKVRNVSGRARRISATGYWEWVLGELRPKNLLHLQTEVDAKTGVLMARNFYNTEYAERIVFVDVNDSTRTLTGDRREFIGRNGTLANPAALSRVRLSGKVGAGLDPCGAVQVAFTLADGQEKETTFRLGVGRNLQDVKTLVQRYRRPGGCREALESAWEYWKKTLGTVQVETPDASVNVMANGWLLYQTLSCRIWGRTGFYQSGGAYGFRDQLQDSMALLHAEPLLTREHILRAAARQFPEGDVQHWWHPPGGRGVRTHFSDDYLWLPYVTCRYVKSLGDTGILNEPIRFVEGRPIRPEEEAYYDLPRPSQESATLYEHCKRAIDYGLRFGAHGLPLMGCGDWNDGMNMVGEKGKGESVWLAFFLCDVLTQFAELAHQRNDLQFHARCLGQAEQLRKNIEDNSWDGDWYRRAYFDDGTPLGSKENEECQIDALPQSWSVISGVGDPARARTAMAAAQKRLVRTEAQLIQLFDPPFDKSHLNPGYIKGYIPGVRENGGQYTHAAVWTVMAVAMLGENERAWQLFNMLNPVNHGATVDKIKTYRVEPYVVAADIYSVPPHTGRGGWTWYTGSAGWMYRLLVETLLGLRLEGEKLQLTPKMPGHWNSFKIHYRFRRTQYHITIIKGVGKTDSTQTIQLVDDGQEHTMDVRF